MMSSSEEIEQVILEKNISNIDKLPSNSTLESTIAWVNKFHETFEHKLATIKLDIQLLKKVQILEKNPTSEQLNSPIYKRNRRKAQQIDRRYKCVHPLCSKCYGSESALKNHVKMKHNENNSGDQSSGIPIKPEKRSIFEEQLQEINEQRNSADVDLKKLINSLKIKLQSESPLKND